MTRIVAILAAAVLALALAACTSAASEAIPAPGSAGDPSSAVPTTSVPRTPAPPPTTTTTTTTTEPPPAPTMPAPAIGAQTLALDVDDTVRTYVLRIPPAAGDGEPLPLVLDLHGLGSGPANQEAASGFGALGAAQGFVVAQPSARGGIPSWNPQPGSEGAARDQAFLHALVADVSGRVAVDPDRVYVAGFSNGGGMAHRFACEAADLVAAFGTVSGQYPVADVCTPSRPVAMISFHGTADVVVAYGGVGRILPDVPTWAQSWADRDECGPVPERERVAADVVRDRWFGCADGVEVALYTVEDGLHAWPGSLRPGFFPPTQSVDATALMWDFFAAHPRR